MGFLGSLNDWVIDHYLWRHLIVGLGILVQGEITVMLSLYLILQNNLSWLGFLIPSGVSIFLYETFLYAVGWHLKDSRLGAWIDKKIPHSAKLQFSLHKDASKYLTFSKFVSYFNIAILILSGWARLRFGNFLKHRLIANTIWLITLITLAYAVVGGLGHLILKKMEIGVLFAIIFIFGAKHLIRKMLNKEANLEEEAKGIGTKVDNFLKN